VFLVLLAALAQLVLLELQATLALLVLLGILEPLALLALLVLLETLALRLLRLIPPHFTIRTELAAVIPTRRMVGTTLVSTMASAVMTQSQVMVLP
jgi:hypothetical protein